MQLPPSPNTIGHSFFELQSVDSTNNYALSRVHEGMAYHGDCFFSHSQTQGKGQLGKNWISEESSNILLSIVLQPDFLEISQQFQLSACVAVATKNFFNYYVKDEITIKWPNDIYWKDRKVGGILIENVLISKQSAVGSWQWAVVGIGININQVHFPVELPNPVSLKQITGKTYDVVDLAKELCGSVDKSFTELRDHGFRKILEQYNEFLYRKNQTVRMKKDNRIFEATIRSVDSSGRMTILHGIEELIDFGQVEWLI